MLTFVIGSMERGRVPDWLVRAGIRRLLRDRLIEESIGDCEQQSANYSRFLAEFNKSAIALNTDDANDQHYEIPAQYYQHALGPKLKYSCALWQLGQTSLAQAEIDMLDSYLERAELKDGMDILELGCGWGSLTLHMAQKFPNSRIVGISNSHSQKTHIEKCCDDLQFKNVAIVTKDINEYNPNQTFDRVISVEMFEHVRNYKQLFEKISTWLKPQGKLFTHIFCHRYLMYPYEYNDESNWMTQYFFKGGQMPAADTFLHFQKQLTLEQRWLVSGTHYEKTCNAWLGNTDRNKQQIMRIFSKTYGKDASIWFQRWRMFYMACAELFGYNSGNEWMVAHYLFAKLEEC